MNVDQDFPNGGASPLGEILVSWGGAKNISKGGGKL